MSNTPTEVRYNIMHALVCAEHFEYGVLCCCPFPGCPNGTDSDEIEAAAPGCEPKIYRRVVWVDADGQKSYSWNDDLPLWFSLRRILWREVAKKGIVKWHTNSSRPIIYHYTSIQGFLGIIDSGEIWASDYRYLNDASELVHGLNLVQERFSIAAQSIPDAKALTSWAGTVDSLRSRVCIASFSSDGDSLSQWRAYGPIAIGFEYGPLMFGYANTVSWREVIYERTIQIELLDLMAHLIASSYAYDARHHSDHVDRMYSDGSDIVLEVVSFLKHNAFADEREIRMAYIENPRMFEVIRGLSPPTGRFRATNSAIVPYVTTRDIADNYPDKLPIKNIVVGPCQNADILQRGVMELLTKRGYENVQVVRSEAPFRP